MRGNRMYLLYFILIRSAVCVSDTLGPWFDNVVVIHRNSSSAMERKEAEAHEQQMKGPGSFPLERLLAIFRCIVVESDSAPSNGFGSFHSGPLFNGNLEEAEGDGHMTEELSADVLMQLSTLVSVNLLSKSSTNPLDGNARYRCNVDGNLIQKVTFFSVFLSAHIFY